MHATLRALIALITLTGFAATATAASSVNVLNLAEEAGALETGQETNLPFTVNFQADGFGCPGGGSATIALELRGAPPEGITVGLDAEEVTITIPSGLYMNAPAGTGPFNGSADGQLSIVASNITQNATLPLTVVATYPGGVPDGCQGSNVPEASGEASTSADFIAPEPEVLDEPVVQAEKGIPAPGALPTIGVLAIGLALAHRRRHA